MSDLLTAEALVEMQQRCDLASKPPWHLESPQDREKYGHRVYDGGAWGVCKMTRGDKPVDEVNAEFIINARDDIPALLAHAAALQVQLDAAYHEGRISGLTSQLIGQHEHTEVVERIVSDFKARVIEALRQVDWELADNVTIIEMIQKLSTTMGQ